MRIYLIIFITALCTLTSCRKDFETVPSKGRLFFSKDTVYLDTVFTGIASSTYTLKVYNRSNEDISIPSIALEKGDASKYRIIVDGMTGANGKGKRFDNVELLAKDSLYIFIEETADIIDANPTDFLYTDKILFDTGSNQQDVDLVTLIQDAIFLYPEKGEELLLDDADPESRIFGFELNENDPKNGNELHFTKQKPYVIYGYAGVPANKTLVIDPGSRVHFHDESGIFVKKQGSIQVNGAVSADLDKLENEVIFEGDRLEPGFADVPGQWGTIYLAEGSTNNSFNHATIKNGSIGIFVDRQDATTTQIKNTKIYNFTNYGIVARKGKINGENIVVNKCGQSSLACILGGEYNFNACTFTNFWNSGARQSPTVYLDNTYKQDDNLFVSDLVAANFVNCIIYGTNTIEVGLKKDNAAAFNFDFSYCLIRFVDNGNQFTGSMYDFVKNPSSKNNIVSNFNTQNDPKFKNAFNNDLRILKTSSALAKGNTAFILPTDANGIARTSPPDLGAYQHLNE